MGSPPPEGSKKEELKFRSQRSIVMAPANTGKAKSNKNTVIIILHINKVNTSIDNFPPRNVNKVTKKFKELRIEEAPAKWREKIIKSKEILDRSEERGGYKVHPPLGPPEINILRTKKKREGNINHTLRLFTRGKHKSKAPLNNGTNQFPKAPIRIGIIIKKIIKRACAEIIEL